MSTRRRIQEACGFLCVKCSEQHTVLLGNLSRFTGLLIVLNITLFFLGGAVVKEGYYFTFYSVGFLAAVEILLIVPHGLFDRLWFYAVALLGEAFAVYFFNASVWHWVATRRN